MGCSPLWLKSPHAIWGLTWKTSQRRSASKGDSIQQPQRPDQPWKTVGPWKTDSANGTEPPAHPEQLPGTQVGMSLSHMPPTGGLLGLLKGSCSLATPLFQPCCSLSSGHKCRHMCTQAGIHPGKTHAHMDMHSGAHTDTYAHRRMHAHTQRHVCNHSMHECTQTHMCTDTQICM